MDTDDGGDEVMEVEEVGVVEEVMEGEVMQVEEAMQVHHSGGPHWRSSWKRWPQQWYRSVRLLAGAMSTSQAAPRAPLPQPCSLAGPLAALVFTSVKGAHTQASPPSGAASRGAVVFRAGPGDAGCWEGY